MNSVDALESPHHIQLVSDFLLKHYGQHVCDCWNLGLQLTLRISDLLSLRYSDIRTRKCAKVISLREGKTNKEKLITLNPKAISIIERRRSDNLGDVYIFQSHSRNMKKVSPISRNYVSVAIKEAGEQPGVQMRLSTHTMRKTRALAIYRNTNDLALVMELLNHSSIAATKRYLGLTQEKVQSTYELVI